MCVLCISIITILLLRVVSFLGLLPVFVACHLYLYQQFYYFLLVTLSVFSGEYKTAA